MQNRVLLQCCKTVTRSFPTPVRHFGSIVSRRVFVEPRSQQSTLLPAVRGPYHHHSVFSRHSLVWFSTQKAPRSSAPSSRSAAAAPATAPATPPQTDTGSTERSSKEEEEKEEEKEEEEKVRALAALEAQREADNALSFLDILGQEVELVLDIVEISKRQVLQHIFHLEALWKANPSVSLVSKKMSKRDIVIKHLFDSLTALKEFPRNKQIKVVADIGAGSGFPTFALAPYFPDIKFKVFEKDKKKLKFLESLLPAFPNVEVCGSFQEHTQLDGVDLVITRAFSSLKSTLSRTQTYFDNGGRYFLMKGRMTKVENELFECRLHTRRRMHKHRIKVQRLPYIHESMEERHVIKIQC